MATIAQTQHRMSQLRAALAGKYGPKKYRINENDEVHAYGPMKGWMFIGYVSDLMHQHCI